MIRTKIVVYRCGHVLTWPLGEVFVVTEAGYECTGCIFDGYTIDQNGKRVLNGRNKKPSSWKVPV